MESQEPQNQKDKTTGKIEFKGKEHFYSNREEKDRLLNNIGSTLKLGRYGVAREPIMDSGKPLYLYGTANAFDNELEDKILDLIMFTMKKLGITLPGQLPDKTAEAESYAFFGYEMGIIPDIRDYFKEALEEALEIIIEDAYKEF